MMTKITNNTTQNEFIYKRACTTKNRDQLFRMVILIILEVLCGYVVTHITHTLHIYTYMCVCNVFLVNEKLKPSAFK